MFDQDYIQYCCRCGSACYGQCCCNKGYYCCQIIGPIGPQGPQGPQGIQGATGPAGPQGLQGEIGPQGPQGLQGEIGPQGPQGLQGEIGPQGLQGATGPAGPQGLQGATGPAGPQGLQGEIGPQGPQGLQGEIGPQGIQGLQGEIGPQGLQGEIGPQGPQGLQGEIGPQGPEGPGSIRHSGVIPFSIDSNHVLLTTDTEGNPSLVQFAGFEANPIISGTMTQLQPGDWAAGTITFNQNNQDQFYRCTFVMPYDAVVKNIHVLFGAKMSVNLPEGASAFPFAGLAVLTSDSPGISTGGMVFTLLQDTITYSAPFVAPTGGGMVPKYTLVRGSLSDIDRAIPAGSLVGIIVGIRAEGAAEEISINFSVSGGILLE